MEPSSAKERDKWLETPWENRWVSRLEHLSDWVSDHKLGNESECPWEKGKEEESETGSENRLEHVRIFKNKPTPFYANIMPIRINIQIRICGVKGEDLLLKLLI